MEKAREFSLFNNSRNAHEFLYFSFVHSFIDLFSFVNAARVETVLSSFTKKIIFYLSRRSDRDLELFMYFYINIKIKQAEPLTFIGSLGEHFFDDGGFLQVAVVRREFVADPRELAKFVVIGP